ncbi:hypothetical protein CBL_20179 [Carabus blaptoides fortunei]
MKRDTCDRLIKYFSKSPFYPGHFLHCGVPTSSAENHILSYLWFSGNKCCIRDVAERFGIGQTTCFRQIIRVTNYLVNAAPTYIKFPRSLEEKQKLAEEFSQISGFGEYLDVLMGLPFRYVHQHIKLNPHM